MSERQKALVRRRDFFRTVTAGLALATSSAIPLVPAAAAPVSGREKRKARYRANSTEVQDFYRVNRYPTQ